MRMVSNKRTGGVSESGVLGPEPGDPAGHWAGTSELVLNLNS